MNRKSLLLMFLLGSLHSFAIVEKVLLSQNKLLTFLPSEHITLCTHEDILEIHSETKEVPHWDHRETPPVLIDAESDFRFDQNGFRTDSQCPLRKRPSQTLPESLGNGDFRGVDIESIFRIEYHTLKTIQVDTQVRTYTMVLGDLEGKCPTLTFRSQSYHPFLKITGTFGFEGGKKQADLNLWNVHVVQLRQPCSKASSEATAHK